MLHWPVCYTGRIPMRREVKMQIQAAVLRRCRGPFNIETLEMDAPREDEVLVRIVASGICHTDIAFADGWGKEDGPVVLGHEGAGVVESAGKLVTAVAPGDHVVLSYQSCGRCEACLADRPWACDRFYELNFGFTRLDGTNALQPSGVRGHFFGQSSFATCCFTTERNTIKVPADVDTDMLAPLGCGLQTGAGTVMNSLAVPSGASIAVLGTGAVGLSAVMAARIVGAHPIIGIDIRANRLALALELGATHVIDGHRPDLPTAIKSITGRGVDYTVETTGDSSMLRLATSLLDPGGTAAMLTGPGALTTPPEGHQVIEVIQGSAVAHRFIPRLIELWRAGRFPFDRLIRYYDFAQINTAVADSRSGDAIKPVLRISRP